MVYRVSATFGVGTLTTVIVDSAAAALAKVTEYQEDGVLDVRVRDMEGNSVAFADLRPLAERSRRPRERDDRR